MPSRASAVDRRRRDVAVAVRRQVIGAERVDADEDDRARDRRRRARVPPAADRGERGAKRDEREDDCVAKRAGTTGRRTLEPYFNCLLDHRPGLGGLGATSDRRPSRAAFWPRHRPCRPSSATVSPSFRSGLPQFGSSAEAFWYHWTAASVLPLAASTSPSVKKISLLAPCCGALIQGAGGGAEVALLHVGLPDADSGFVAVGIRLEQIVVGGERAVVVLLVAIRGADLQVDDAQRRGLGQDRLVRRDRLVPLLRVELLIGGSQFGLQILDADAAERARRRLRRSLATSVPARTAWWRAPAAARLRPGSPAPAPPSTIRRPSGR